MIKRILLVCLILQSLTGQAQERPIVKGMVLSKSTKIRKATYRLDAANDSSFVIIIEGNNITIDFNGAELRGSNGHTSPDEFFGRAVLIRNSRNVIIKNLKARGYRIALMASNVEQLTVDNCDLSYNYRQHLNSTQEREDVSDWMSYHKNDNDEWLRYGAAIYLRDCNNAVVTRCTVTGGQNALMMVRSDRGRIYDNDFSFNSGVGIGMYRCNDNQVAYNRLDFNVRGYSHAVYKRGQDSAGILVYEQSSRNLFYRNSATHSGDGFFLWAGQTTMDSGEGGCNDNRIIENNFSYAPTNGIEVTFSRNVISGNRMFECDHGIWGGYSYATRIEKNQFRNNRVGIAIEHGLHNAIVNNLFSGDTLAIRLWARAEQPSDWGYAKVRDTRSAGYDITLNSFNRNKTVLHARRTDSLNIANNSYSGYDDLFDFDQTVTGIDSIEMEMDEPGPVLTDIMKPKTIPPSRGHLAGRKNILMTEWGPYDFRSPIAWWTNPAEAGDTLRFEVKGPKGTWKLGKARGLRFISLKKGTVPGSFVAVKENREATDISLDFEYRGATVTSPLGQTFSAGKVYNFRWQTYFQPMQWQMLFFAMDTANHNPIRSGQLFSPVARRAPFRRDTVEAVAYNWWGGMKEGEVQHRQFITLGSATAEMRPGNYEISLTWDDAVRFYVDDSLVVDEWEPTRYRFDETPNRKIKVYLGGTHYFRLEHVELGGFASLQLKFRRLDD